MSAATAAASAIPVISAKYPPGRISLLLEDDRRACFHNLPELARIPIRQPNTPMRLRVSDLRRLGRAMNPVVLFRQSDPDHAYRIVGPGLYLGFGVGAGRVPEQIGIIVKDRIVG